MHPPSTASARHLRGGAVPLQTPGTVGRDAARHRGLWLPLIVLATAIALVYSLELDWRLAHRIYAWEGYRWLLRKSFLTQTVLHRLGHDLSVAAWVGVTLTWLVSLRRESLHVWRRPLACLILSVLTATVLVAAIKSLSNMDCPWDIDGLGGTRPYVRLFELRPAYLPHASCFPAGHASGGYAWMSLYFFFAATVPRLRWYGLALGAGTGLIFGFAQQLRGAHFLSHDLWTIAICWFVAYGLHEAFQPTQTGSTEAADEFAALPDKTTG